MPHKFDAAHAHVLDAKERRSFQNPEEILERAGVKRGMIVVDIGAGTGYFSIPATKIVGGEGKVYAVDIQPEMLAKLGEKARGVENILCVPSKEEEIPLRSESMDAALLVNVLHELDGYATLREAWRLLKENGKLVVVDWKKEPTPIGPPVEERLSEDEARAKLAKAGFKLDSSFSAGPYHYGLIFKPVELEEESSGTTSADSVVDARGLCCNSLIMKIYRGTRKVKHGEVAEIVATGHACAVDVPVQVNGLGMEIVGREVRNRTFVTKAGKKYRREYHFYVKKK